MYADRSALSCFHARGWRPFHGFLFQEYGKRQCLPAALMPRFFLCVAVGQKTGLTSLTSNRKSQHLGRVTSNPEDLGKSLRSRVLPKIPSHGSYACPPNGNLAEKPTRPFGSLSKQGIELGFPVNEGQIKDQVLNGGFRLDVAATPHNLPKDPRSERVTWPHSKARTAEVSSTCSLLFNPNRFRPGPGSS
jgi:hypothetical protein